MTAPYYGNPSVPAGGQPQQPQAPPQQQQPQFAPQQPQYQPQPTQVIHTSEPGMTQAAPQVSQPWPQPQPVQQPQTQQQPQWPQAPQQPQQQPQAPAQQPQQQQPPAGGIRFDQNGRVMPGPGIKPEIVGKDINQIMRMYDIVREAYVETQIPQQQPQRQQAPPPQYAYQPQQPQAPQAQQPQRPPDFWTDPEGAIARVVDQRIAPMVQQTQYQQVQAARNTVATAFTDFAEHEPEVIRRLQGSSPELLANPQAWSMVYMQIKGEESVRRQASGQQPQQQMQQPNNGFQQIPMPPASQMPYQPAPQFFTENPTAPWQNQQVPEQQLTPQELAYAAKMGVSPADYLNGKLGRFV